MIYRTDVCGMPRIESYAQALAYFNEVKPVRGRKDGFKPIAHRRGWNRRMALKDNGDVVFTLHHTDVVTWHADGSLTIEGHPTLTTAMFANHLTPQQVTLQAARGIIVFGDPTMSTRWHWWERIDMDDGRAVYRPRRALKVVRCGLNDRVRFVQRGDRWDVAPGQKLEPLDYYVLDRARARKLNAEYRLGELRAWVKAIQKLGGEFPPGRGKPMNHADTYCAARRGDFAEAYHGLRQSHYWERSSAGWVQKIKVRDSAFRLLRTQLYLAEGAYEERQATIMSYRDWIRLIYNSRV